MKSSLPSMQSSGPKVAMLAEFFAVTEVSVQLLLQNIRKS